MAGDSSSALFAPTGNDNIAPTPFYVLNWVFFALCVIAFSVRVYIRFTCFRRLVLEDYLMLIALALHCAEAVLIQLFVGYMYDVETVEKGDLSVIGPDFFDHAKKGFVALGASVNITIVGVLIIKLNFLLFFKRLGASIRKFNIAWWAVTVFTVASAITQIGMQTFGCFFGSTDYIFSNNCAAEPALTRIFINAIFSAVVDAVSDVMILCFPVWILWGSGITLRKKIALTFVFGLVWLTIAITIVRGSIFHEQYSMAATGGASQMQSATFTWFWFYMEFSVAFLIACVVSFRSLFVQRAKMSSAPRQEQEWREAAYRSAMRRGQGWRAKWQKLQDNVLETCKTLEGWTGSDAETLNGNGFLPSVPSGLMTVDFHDDDNWKKNTRDDSSWKKHTPGMETTTMTTVSAVPEAPEPYQYQQSPPYQQAQYQQDAHYQQYPQYQPFPQPHDQYAQYQQDAHPAPTGSVHSEETLLQEPEAAHVKQSPVPVGLAR